jgi:hypothetical protein
MAVVKTPEPSNIPAASGARTLGTGPVPAGAVDICPFLNEQRDSFWTKYNLIHVIFYRILNVRILISYHLQVCKAKPYVDSFQNNFACDERRYRRISEEKWTNDNT